MKHLLLLTISLLLAQNLQAQDLSNVTDEQLMRLLAEINAVEIQANGPGVNEYFHEKAKAQRMENNVKLYGMEQDYTGSETVTVQRPYAELSNYEKGARLAEIGSAAAIHRFNQSIMRRR